MNFIFLLIFAHSLMVMFLVVPLMVLIYLNLFALLEHLRLFVASIVRNKFLPAKLLNQGYRYHKLRKAFSFSSYQNFTVDTIN